MDGTEEKLLTIDKEQRRKLTGMDDFSLNLIKRATAETFRSFGGGQKPTANNIISHALKDNPPEFAAGVSIEAVVLFVISMANHINKVV